MSENLLASMSIRLNEASHCVQKCVSCSVTHAVVSLYHEVTDILEFKQKNIEKPENNKI